jgi:cobalt-zinc-cadmium efflux system outer membrane protein
VIELGAKRDARVSAANARLSILEYQQQAFTLDVLGELTAVFIKTLEVQELLGLAKEARDLAENTLSIVQNRSDQGAAPDSEVQRAAASLAQTELQLDALQRAHKRQIINLAAYWGEQWPTWPQLSGNLFAYSSLTTYPGLYQRALSSPAIEVFASTERLKTAELNLAKTQSILDINWQVGVRRFEESGDSAFIAGMSIPLFGGTRNRGNITSVLAERNEVEYQRQAALQQLHVQLYAAYSQYEQYVNAVESFQAKIIPNFSSALKATQLAYETGRYSYQDWIAAQKELLNAKQILIESATAASLNQAVIEQLIAAPLIP